MYKIRILEGTRQRIESIGKAGRARILYLSIAEQFSNPAAAEADMNNFFSLALITVLLGTTVLGFSRESERDSNREMQNRFVGAWRLVWLEEPDADGKIHRADCTGLLVYTRDAHMSVQVMYRSAETGGQGGPVQYAQGGYEASFGSYQVDANSHTFTFHVEGALVRSLVGKDLARAFALSGNQLIVTSTNPNEHWRVAWEHY